MCKTYRGIVAANVPRYGHIELEAADDFAALLTVLRDFGDYSMDDDGESLEERIVELYEVAEDGTEREVATDWLTSDSEREHWDKVQKLMAPKRQPTEAEKLARAFKRAERPTCRTCGSTDVHAEVTSAYWDADRQVWEAADICDKGHYCSDCDGETRIDWMIVI